MNIKGKFKQSSVITQFLILFFVIVIGLVLVAIISSFVLILKFGIGFTTIVQETMYSVINSPEWIKNIQFFQTVGVFIFPAITCAWLFSDNYKSYLRIDTFFQLSIIWLVMLSILLAIPFLNCIYEFNQRIVFPQCLVGLERLIKNHEKLVKNTLEKILYIHSWHDLIFIILIVCVFSPIGEEFIFRGILQNILGRLIKNYHIVIWVVAIFFSIIHFQFYGFLPRMLLGAYLGYLLYYTNNIWVPALAHFTNNFLSIINFYFFQKKLKLAEEIYNICNNFSWCLSILSLTLFFVIFYTIKRKTFSNLSK